MVNLRSLFSPTPQVCLGTHGPFGLFKTTVPLSSLNIHTYIIGASGQGKSQFMLSLANQLIRHGQGVALIDPHGDLVSDLISLLASGPANKSWLSVPANRRRVIYLDPRSDCLIPFNPLALQNVDPYVIAQNVIESFRRTWSEELSAAPRFANIALHSLLVLIANRLSLVELPRLLTNKPYREQLLQHVTDDKLLHFFRERFERWGRETPLMIESLLNKSTALTLNPFLAPMLGASQCLSLRTLMDQGKILLVNLRTPDEETRNLLGSLLTTFFEQAALSRESLPPAKRRRYYLFLDEFQKFTATEGSVATLAEILSECRKFSLFTVFAHQSLAQLASANRLAGGIEQTQMKVIFGTGRATAQAIASTMYLPDPHLVKHEVEDPDQQVRSHPLFESLYNQLEMAVQTMMRLKRRQILVKLPEQDELVRLRTPTVPATRMSREQLAAIKAALAKQAGRPRQDLEAEMQKRVETYGVPPDSAPVRQRSGYGARWREG